MTDEPDAALERELTGLLPRPLSDACQQRIGSALTEQQKTGVSPRMKVGFAGAGTLAAACLIVAVSMKVFGPEPAPPDTMSPRMVAGRDTPVSQTPPLEATDTEPAGPPTVAAYWHALAESTDAFDALINRQAASEGGARTDVEMPASLAVLTRSWLTPAHTPDDR